MKVKPLSDRVLIRPTQAPKQSKGGIALPDSAEKTTQKGEVIAVGPGKWDAAMFDADVPRRPAYAPMHVKPGDVVLFSRYAGSDSRDVEALDGMILVSESDILAVLE